MLIEDQLFRVSQLMKGAFIQMRPDTALYDVNRLIRFVYVYRGE
jgi:hypothetical protein